MAVVLSRRRRSGDLLGAFFELYQVPADVARPLYPLALAVFVINAMRIANADAQEAGDPKAFRPLAIVELEGFEFFRKVVNGEFRDSQLEEFEVREAFDIICTHARDPGKPLTFKAVSKEQQRRTTQATRAIEELQRRAKGTVH